LWLLTGTRDGEATGENAERIGEGSREEDDDENELEIEEMENDETDAAEG